MHAVVRIDVSCDEIAGAVNMIYSYLLSGDSFV